MKELVVKELVVKQQRACAVYACWVRGEGREGGEMNANLRNIRQTFFYIISLSYDHFFYITYP